MWQDLKRGERQPQKGIMGKGSRHKGQQRRRLGDTGSDLSAGKAGGLKVMDMSMSMQVQTHFTVVRFVPCAGLIPGYFTFISASCLSHHLWLEAFKVDLISSVLHSRTQPQAAKKEPPHSEAACPRLPETDSERGHGLLRRLPGAVAFLGGGVQNTKPCRSLDA